MRVDAAYNLDDPEFASRLPFVQLTNDGEAIVSFWNVKSTQNKQADKQLGYLLAQKMIAYMQEEDHTIVMSDVVQEMILQGDATAHEPGTTRWIETAFLEYLGWALIESPA